MEPAWVVEVLEHPRPRGPRVSRHDRLTRGHCERVRAYTDLAIQEMKLPPEQANKLRWAALLHDIGKLTVPAELLSKRGPLTDAEFEVVKTHAAEGLRICAPLAPWLGEWLRAIGKHHERWDGGGYPAGLAGDAIHLGARIVAVTDTFDVITSTRSYKRARSITAARQEITRCAGTQFDPAVVRAFLNVGLHRLRFEAGLLAWFASLAFVPSTAIAPLALNGILGVVATGAGVIPELDRSDGPPLELAFDGQPDELPVLDDPAVRTGRTASASGRPRPPGAKGQMAPRRPEVHRAPSVGRSPSRTRRPRFRLPQRRATPANRRPNRRPAPTSPSSRRRSRSVPPARRSPPRRSPQRPPPRPWRSTALRPRAQTT